MQISLEEAVEIHARALTRRLSNEAPVDARERAVDLQRVGDKEGHSVWMRVAESAERLLSESARSAETTLYK